jgi:putative ABC transport system permease protein
MIYHYLKIAFRNLARQKALAFINIAGLTIGIACFTLFLLYAVNELSYDRFHANASQIYRVYDWWDFKGEKPREGREPSSSTPLGPALKQDFPEVKEFIRISGSGNLTRIDGEIQKVNITYADPQFFSVFTFPFLHGNPSTALNQPNKLVLTKEKAKQLFGEENPIGRTIELKNGDEYRPFVISGVTEDIPVNSSIRFDVIGSFENVLATEHGKASMSNWNMTIGISVYVQLREGSNLANDQARLNTFYAKYHSEDAA